MAWLTLSVLTALSVACGIVESESDIVVELRERTITPGDSATTLMIRYAVTNTTDHAGELGHCCIWTFLLPEGREDVAVLPELCLLRCPSGPLIPAHETLQRVYQGFLPLPGTYRLGVVYRLQSEDQPSISWSRAFEIR